MTNYNKLNPRQKEIMAEFKHEHQSLAKNLLPNCAQGKATANRLWDELAKRLNAVGPPVKNVQMWKKAYVEQKYQAKKKVAFNKLSKNQTGGGPYEEKFLTLSEEHLIEAAGLEATVEGNKSVPTFGNAEILNTVQELDLSNDSNLDNDEPSCNKGTLEKTCDKRKTPRSKRGADQKLLLLEKNIKVATDFYAHLDSKIDRLLDIQERQLQMKMEKHQNDMAIAALDLKIKKLQHKDLQNNTICK